MSKKWAILITVGVMAVVYLFLLVGIPAIASLVPPCGSCNSTETANNTAILEDFPTWGMLEVDNEPIAVDNRPIREKYKAPLIIYLIPGMFGIAAIMIILKQKKEVNNGN